MKLAVDRAVPAAVVTDIFPEVAAGGTVTVMVLSLTTVKVAVMPLSFTEIAPVNLVPLTVTELPTAALSGENPST